MKAKTPVFAIGDRVRVKPGAFSKHARRSGVITELVWDKRTDSRRCYHGIVRVQFVPGGYGVRFYEHEVEKEAQ